MLLIATTGHVHLGSRVRRSTSTVRRVRRHCFLAHPALTLKLAAKLGTRRAADRHDSLHVDLGARRHLIVDIAAAVAAMVVHIIIAVVIIKLTRCCC